MGLLIGFSSARGELVKFASMVGVPVGFLRSGGIGTLTGGVTQHFLQQNAMDRETKRQMMSSESQSRLAESQARISALQASQRGGDSNALLWVGGGIFLLALVGGGIYFATRK